ncbi:Zinc finger, RING/FYVE/PHD-type [Cynara cardunculus var. scolymus]|uniref:RING-type E3 ubiquitin transferase n=1 Tax=Cynara cardunculus var. scolymus TaxID=59895 RepID=A0A103XQ06_CYNCS|nr:Zinc finger, RING/FYVE/PHD-type [Cynara cardunculus var. scolymus]
MDMNQYPHDISTPVSFCLWLCGRRIRVYSVSSIVSGDFHPDVLAQSLRFYRPLPYPYTWYVYGEQAAIVNIIDLQAYEQTHHQSPSYSTTTYYQPQEAIDHYQYSETIDEVALLQDLNMNQINDSFEQASELVAKECSGLTKELISKNLRVTKYREEGEEESEVCVVCQVEFENNERVGVLQCRHRFHPKCINEWLLRKNVCPLCKGQALKV